VKFLGPNCPGEVVTLQPGLGAYPQAIRIFLVRSGIGHKHFMVCFSNQMSIGQLLANDKAKVCPFRFRCHSIAPEKSLNLRTEHRLEALPKGRAPKGLDDSAQGLAQGSAQGFNPGLRSSGRFGPRSGRMTDEAKFSDVTSYKCPNSRGWKPILFGSRETD
jgi:hypothetical protein